VAGTRVLRTTPATRGLTFGAANRQVWEYGAVIHAVGVEAADPPAGRPRRGRMVAGVAAWIAHRLGMPPWGVRVAFTALTFAGGVGAALYVVAWLLIPDEGTAESIARTARRARHDRRQVVAVAMVVLGILLLLRQSGLWFDDGVVWPVAVAAVGLFVIWRQAERRPHALVRITGARDLRSTLRVVGGVALVVAGVGLFLAANQALVAARQGLLATMAVVSGVATVFAPWWARLGRDLASERAERIRSQERAELAAHIHDSVLQTLALIQRNAHDPRTVGALARRQERDLRTWLFVPDTDVSAPPGSLAGALASVAAETEDHYGVSVDVVGVGDLALDEALGAMVSATREALTNAARHSGATEISLYAEVEEGQATVFVRDKGCGFVLGAVDPGRRGVAESIIGRMHRHGGEAHVRTHLGEGTEVEMSLPRWAPP